MRELPVINRHKALQLQGYPQHCHQAPDACVQGSQHLLHAGSPALHINSGHIAPPNCKIWPHLRAAFTCSQAQTAGLHRRATRARHSSTRRCSPEACCLQLVTQLVYPRLLGGKDEHVPLVDERLQAAHQPDLLGIVIVHNIHHLQGGTCLRRI